MPREGYTPVGTTIPDADYEEFKRICNESKTTPGTLMRQFVYSVIKETPSLVDLSKELRAIKTELYRHSELLVTLGALQYRDSAEISLLLLDLVGSLTDDEQAKAKIQKKTEQLEKALVEFNAYLKSFGPETLDKFVEELGLTALKALQKV